MGTKQMIMDELKEDISNAIKSLPSNLGDTKVILDRIDQKLELLREVDSRTIEEITLKIRKQRVLESALSLKDAIDELKRKRAGREEKEAKTESLKGLITQDGRMKC